MQFLVPGPCTVTIGGTDMGHSKDGVTIRIVSNWIPIIDDEGGNEPQDYIWGGRAAIVSMLGAEATAAGYDTELTGEAATRAFEWVDPGIVKDDSSAKVLLITMLSTAEFWSAPNAFPVLGEMLELLSTQELRVPINFLVVPNANGQLFTAVPAFITAEA